MELEEKENMILDSDSDDDEAGFEDPADECRDLDQVKLDHIWIWRTTYCIGFEKQCLCSCGCSGPLCIFQCTQDWGQIRDPYFEPTLGPWLILLEVLL